jgi:NADH-quinone oxidoreductase subunit M
MGLPGLNGFIGEFLVIIGAYNENFWWAFTAAIGVVLAAAYFLWLYQRVFFGPLENEKNKILKDCSAREAWQFAPLIVLSLWIGLYPKPFLSYLEKPVEELLLHMEEARAFGEGEERLVQAEPPAPPEPAVVAEEISLEPESLRR